MSRKPSVADLLASMQAELAETRRQLMEVMTRRDPKDLTVQEVVDAYLRELPDQIDPERLEDRKRCLIGFAASCGEKRISECGPLDISDFFKTKCTQWASGWTKGSNLTHIKRCFNWARNARLIREFPFHGVSREKGESGRPMPDSVFRIFLLNTPPSFRRFLFFLRHTGCRPSEASRMRWQDVDFERQIVVLKEHKTVKKTDKPRILILTPTMIKLLRWEQRNRGAGDDWRGTARWLHNLLRAGPVRVKEITHRARELGITDRRLYRAREILGVTYERVGGWAAKGYTVYRLPNEVAAEIIQPPNQDQHVFVNWRGEAWNKRSLACLLQRLRRHGVIKSGMKLYGLRHRLATELCRSGVNLKVVASIMGHEYITTTMGYTKTIGDDTSLLLTELQKLSQGVKR